MSTLINGPEISQMRQTRYSAAQGFVITLRRNLALVTTGQVGTRSGPSWNPVGTTRPESRPESLEVRVFRRLAESPLSKAELAAGLGQKEISGQLNKVVRVLLGDQTIEYTIPHKPSSRMQRYRLTAKGRAVLAKLKPAGEKA